MLVNDINVDKKMISEVMGDWSNALKIPVIQRDFVWNAEDVKDLRFCCEWLSHWFHNFMGNKG